MSVEKSVFIEAYTESEEEKTAEEEYSRNSFSNLLRIDIPGSAVFTTVFDTSILHYNTIYHPEPIQVPVRVKERKDNLLFHGCLVVNTEEETHTFVKSKVSFAKEKTLHRIVYCLDFITTLRSEYTQITPEEITDQKFADGAGEDSSYSLSVSKYTFEDPDRTIILPYDKEDVQWLDSIDTNSSESRSLEGGFTDESTTGVEEEQAKYPFQLIPYASSRTEYGTDSEVSVEINEVQIYKKEEVQEDFSAEEYYRERKRRRKEVLDRLHKEELEDFKHQSDAEQYKQLKIISFTKGFTVADTVSKEVIKSLLKTFPPVIVRTAPGYTYDCSLIKTRNKILSEAYKRRSGTTDWESYRYKRIKVETP
jgi:hypothetical protein